MSAIWANLKQKALANFTDAIPHEQHIIDSFRLPDNEVLLAESSVDFRLRGSEIADDSVSGHLYLTTSYLCYRSFNNETAIFIIPLFAIKKVERLKTKLTTYTIVVTTWHGLHLHLEFVGLHHQTDFFCDVFKQGLKKQQSNLKILAPFLKGCYSEYMRNGDREDKLEVPPAGLGRTFQFPGDPRKLKDNSKMRLWRDYMNKSGRNLTIVRFPTFNKLVRVGLPNDLRGEIWELTSGAMLSRWANPNTFKDLQKDNLGKSSISIEEIEKDLNRSLPEYPAYQDDNVGIGALRRVLTAYSWRNPELGYCQAMNIVVAALLIYATEEQSFWLLDKLCSEMLPGYYSTTMYGTLLDQRVFEALVERTMPILWSHFQRLDLQLSLVSLPWFLSLFINSMPLVFAFRVLDCFFLEGPRVLFQVGLAILKINGDSLLAVTDDGSFIEILKAYFMTLGDSAYPASTDVKTRSITVFQILVVTAFKEFNSITHAIVINERRKHKNVTLDSIEQFARRTQLRSLSNTGRLSKEEIGNIYDRYHSTIYKQRVGFGGLTDTRMDYSTFRVFMAGIASWAQDPEGEHAFMHLLFSRWDSEFRNTLSLQDVVQGLAEIRTDETTPMETISWFFEVYDRTGDGKLKRDDLLRVTEGLLWLTRHESDDNTLRAMSSFIHHCFDYAEQDDSVGLIDVPASGTKDHDNIYVTLATFRMVVLADQALEDFLTRFPATLRFSAIKVEDGSTKGLRGFLDAVMTDTQKIAAEIRKNVKEIDEEIGHHIEAHKDTEPDEADKAVLQHDLLA